jgi:hypothetical protein
MRIDAGSCDAVLVADFECGINRDFLVRRACVAGATEWST